MLSLPLLRLLAGHFQPLLPDSCLPLNCCLHLGLVCKQGRSLPMDALGQVLLYGRRRQPITGSSFVTT